MRHGGRAIGILWMASIPVLMLGFVRSSIAAEAARQGPFSATPLVGKGAPNAPMSVPPTGPTLLIVKQGVNYNLAGWEELYNGCVISSGTWQVTQQPTHGSTSTQIINSGTDACGNSNAYNTIFYTWTDTSAKSGTEDNMNANWSTSDGRFFYPYNWTFDYQALADSQDYGGSGKSGTWWYFHNGMQTLHAIGEFVFGPSPSAAPSVQASFTTMGTLPSGFSVVGQRDFDGDGKTDILWEDTSGNVSIWFLNGTQVASAAGVANVPTNWSVAGTGDFNNDGKADILWRDTSGNVAIWLMNGSQVSSSVFVANVPTTWSIVGTGDFNSDGMTDILWRDNSGNVAIWLMNGGKVSSSAVVASVPTTWSIVGTGDFNGDGKTDILWRDVSGNLAIWMMNGGQVSLSVFVANVPTSWSVVDTGDFFNSGKTDIFWRDTAGDTAIWEMNGGVVTSTDSVGNFDPNWSIASAGNE